MSSCVSSSINKHDLKVIEKFESLMQASLGDESIYTRVKDTMKIQFDELDLTQEEKAQMVSQTIAQYMTAQTSASMQAALQWAETEATIGYQTALIEAQAESALASAELACANIDKVKKEKDQICANITKITGDSLRENGKPAYGSDGCRVIALDDSGVKYEQIKGVKATTYAAFAKAYRESGVVYVNEGTDGMLKGLNGEGANQDNGSGNKVSGSLNMNIDNVVRNTEGYDDTMRQYAANSASQTLSGLIASDIGIDYGEGNATWTYYNESLAYLTEKYNYVQPVDPNP